MSDEKFSDLPFINKLVVHFDDSKWLSWEVEVKTDTDIIKPWIKFHKWYFGRPQSDTFTISHRSGFTMFKRENIKRIVVNVQRGVPNE